MYANVTIAATIPNVLTLPNEAVLSDEGGRPFCFIVENGKAIEPIFEWACAPTV